MAACSQDPDPQEVAVGPDHSVPAQGVQECQSRMLVKSYSQSTLLMTNDGVKVLKPTEQVLFLFIYYCVWNREILGLHVGKLVPSS